MPIQAQTWPIIVSGRDLIGLAETGSGKTLAYALPAYVHLLGQERSAKDPVVLVVAPTRELVMQISRVLSEPLLSSAPISMAETGKPKQTNTQKPNTEISTSLDSGTCLRVLMPDGLEWVSTRHTTAK